MITIFCAKHKDEFEWKITLDLAYEIARFSEGFCKDVRDFCVFVDFQRFQTSDLPLQ